LMMARELSPRVRADPTGLKGAQGEGLSPRVRIVPDLRGVSGGRGEHSPRVRCADPDLSEDTIF
jgi:hypothetical protein